MNTTEMLMPVRISSQAGFLPQTSMTSHIKICARLQLPQSLLETCSAQAARARLDNGGLLVRDVLLVLNRRSAQALRVSLLGGAAAAGKITCQRAHGCMPHMPFAGHTIHM